MNIRIRWALEFVGVLIGGLLIAAFLIFTGIGTSTPELGPADVFESHLAALDAGDWRLADTFVKDECTVGFTVGYDDSQEALDAALDTGFSFRRAFDVEEVWISEDGTEAILGLNVVSSLPDIATLEKIDGEWLVAC